MQSTWSSGVVLLLVMSGNPTVATCRGQAPPPAPVVQRVWSPGQGIPVAVQGTLAVAVPANGWLFAETERRPKATWINDCNGDENGVPLGWPSGGVFMTKTE